MTVFDYLVLFIVGCSTLASLVRGVVKEILSLLSWVISLVCANLFADRLADMLPEGLPGHVTRLIVAFIALFIVVRLLMMLVMGAVDAMIRASGLGIADRTLGAVFGFARGIVIVLSGVIACGLTTMPQQPFWREAMLSPYAEQAAHAVKPLLPGNFAQHVKF